MSDGDHILIFGSFTEAETRSFQKPEAENGTFPLEMTGLQFGSLNFASFVSSSGFPTEKTKCNADLKAGEHVLQVVTEEKIYDNVKASKVDVSTKVPENQQNGCMDSHGHLDELDRNTEASKIVISECIEETKSSYVEVSGAADSHIACDKKLKGIAILTTYEDTIQNDGSYDDSSVFASSKLDTNKVANGGTMKRFLPRGLINSGNLCFLNATLQALLSCLPFVQLLQDLRTRNIPKVGYPTLSAFVEFIADFDFPNDSCSINKEVGVIKIGKSFNPIMFEGVLKKFTPDILICGMSSRPRQEDAQEFLSFVMDQMHDELLRFGGQSNANGLKPSLVSSSEDDGWETVGPKNKSAVTRTQSFVPSELSEIFGGQLRSVVKARGNKASATVQPFLLLHLDILPEAVHTILDALHIFSAPESLEGYRSSAGRKAEVVSASKSVKIQNLPKIMILHLMRFSYGSKGSTKLHKPVRFPLELVIGRELLVSSSPEGRKYELVATITHHGREPSKGHYTADTKFSCGQWLRYDDASVTAIGTSDVLHDRAYVLFYRQV